MTHTRKAQLRTRNKQENPRRTIKIPMCNPGSVQRSQCSLSLDKVLVCSPPQVILFRPAGTTRLYNALTGLRHANPL